MYSITELFVLFFQVIWLLAAVIFLLSRMANRMENIQRAQYFSNNPQELDDEICSGIEKEIEEQVDELLKE